MVRRYPRYPSDEDYNTNSPDFYNYLARFNKLMKILAEKIYDYDKELAKRFEEWDKNLEELPEDLKRMLEEWMKDGTLDHIINENIFNLLNSKIDDAVINVKYPPYPLEGAVGDGITDDTATIQTIYDSLKDGQTLLAVGDFLITNLEFNKPNVHVDIRGNFIQKKNQTGAAITLGHLTQANKDIRANLSVKKEGVSEAVDWIEGSTGVELLNIQNSDITVEVEGFHRNLRLRANMQGCAYNHITIITLINGKINLSAVKSNNGWVNENKYYGGRFTWDNRFGDVEGKKHIEILDSQMNQNIFFSPSLEGNGGTYLDINGFHNVVYSPRFETNDPKRTVFINLSENSLYNVIFYPYGNDLNEDNYINKGLRNSVYFRDLVDSQNIFKGAAGIFKGNPYRFGTQGSATVDATNIGSSTNNVWAGRNSGGEITSHITGLGQANFKGLNSDGLVKVNNPIGDNQPAFEVFNASKTEPVLQLYGNGALYGKIQVAEDYMNNHFVPFAVKVTSGKPTDNPLKVGITVLNVPDRCLYIHVGAGVWETLPFQ